MIELLRRYLVPRWRLAAANVVFVALQVFFQTVCVMGQTQKILDTGVATQNQGYVVHEGIIMLGYTLLSAVCTVVASYLSAKVVAHVITDVRAAFFKKSVSLSEQDFARFGASTLLNRIMTAPYDVQVLVINLLRTSMMAPFIIVFVLAAILRMNLVLFAILLVFFVATVATLVVFGARARKPFADLQAKSDRINSLMREKFSGARTIRAFGNEDLEVRKLQEADEEAFVQAIEANRGINFLAPASMVLLNWAVVVIYVAGSQQMRLSLASLSDIIMVFTYLGYFTGALGVVPVLVNIFPKVAVSSRRLLEVLDYEPEVTLGEGGKKEGIDYGEVEFSHVIFGYTGAVEVIADVTFCAKAGKVTALIGTTGSGKTTIANLLMGLYQMNFGDILIDGTSIRDLDGEYLRSKISYATQRPLVFQDTVRNNVSAYAKGVSDDQILDACEAAGFTEVLETMADGLDTEMAAGGMNVSGGQRQRLSLARTLLKDAPIYIFDDTFSALDAKTEARVREQIAERLRGKTIIMVAQKISTIIDADNIIVLDRGRIVGQGRHDELLATCEQYQEIYRTQYYTRSGREATEHGKA